MLLHNGTTALSPLRNSSLDVILMVANLDIKWIDRETSLTLPEPNTAVTILTQSLKTSQIMMLKTIQSLRNKRGPTPISSCLGGTPEMHHRMRVLMTETMAILANLQLKFHLLLESQWLLELEVPRDYMHKVEINNQAMEQLNCFQFY